MLNLFLNSINYVILMQGEIRFEKNFKSYLKNQYFSVKNIHDLKNLTYFMLNYAYQNILKKKDNNHIEKLNTKKLSQVTYDIFNI